MKSSRHKKTPTLAGDGALVNEINFEEEIVMSDISTATSNVIPFDFRGHSVRAVIIDDEPWFVATDVCKILKQSNTTKALYSLDDDERSNFKLGRQGMVNIINESGLYTLTLRCDDAIKKGSTAHAFRRWVASEVLPSIRKTGIYIDSSNKMSTLMDELIGMSELNVIKGLIRDKAKAVPTDQRQGFQLVMHNRLHTRFNVPRTELIPAAQFDQACNFIAAYAVLEGEFIPKGQGKSFDIPEKLGQCERYLVSADAHGNRQVTPVPMGAFVLTRQQFMQSMLVHGDMPVSTAEMFEFVALATENLRRRSLYQAARRAVA